MRDAVLIIAPARDIHATAVATVLDRDFGVKSVIWDRALLPLESRLDFRLDAMTCDIKLETPDGHHALDAFRSIWWRRPEKFRIDPAVTDRKVMAFCYAECDALFRGAVQSLDIPIVNDPLAEFAAEKKPFQLAMARQAGLEIPRTLMSNNPDSIRAFWRDLAGNCIYKPFTSTDWKMNETRHLRAEDLPHLETLRHAPVIVQERIAKGVDVRVNIFGAAVFAAEISTQLPEADLDWRIDVTGQWRPHDLPAALAGKLQDLLADLGLQCGCIDLRQRPDGSYVFFEVNPSGQFLFAEIDTGQPLLRAMAQVLVAPARRDVRRSNAA